MRIEMIPEKDENGKLCYFKMSIERVFVNISKGDSCWMMLIAT